MFGLQYLLLILTILLLISILVRKSARIITLLTGIITILFVILNNPTYTSFNYGSLSILYMSFRLVFISSVIIILIGIVEIFVSARFNARSGFYVFTQFLGMSLVILFTTNDFLLFYIAWEMVLIPTFFMIGIWGGPNKDYAAMKFFIYTHVGSVFMLLAIFTMYFQEGATNFSMYYLMSNLNSIPLAYQSFVLFGFALAFLIKLPSVPLHTWLPDAYVEAPYEGTVIISSLLSKMGAFGLLFIFINLFQSSGYYGSTLIPWILVALGIISLIYSALVALYQKDMKRMMSYASIGHMSFITIATGGFLILGSGLYATLLYYGAVFQIISHGLIISLIFSTVGSVEKSTGTRNIVSMGGLARKVPFLSFILLASFLASVAIPGFSGFVGEISVLIGSYGFLKIYFIFIMIGIVLTASYHIYTLQRTIFGPYNEYLGNIMENRNEILASLILLIPIIVLGIYPSLILHFFNISQIGMGVFK